MTAPFLRILPILLFSITTFGQSADLAIVSVVPSQTTVTTDQTFHFTARVRNQGPDPADKVTVAVGANALALLQKIQVPNRWTCDLSAPHFGYAVTCSTATLAAGDAAELTLTLGAAQHTAMTYRVTTLAGSSTPDPIEKNNGHETSLVLQTSERHSELALTAQTDPRRRAQFVITNNGPDEARELTVIVGQGVTGGPTLTASGSGWKCALPGTSVACTRASLATNTSATLTAGALVDKETTLPIEARVRAEQVYDSDFRNNTASVTVVAPPAKPKRRAVRP